MVQESLNHTPTYRSRDRPPADVFTRHPRKCSLSTFLHPAFSEPVSRLMEIEMREKDAKDLHAALDKMHRDVSTHSSNRRKKAQMQHDNAQNCKHGYFSI